MNQKIPPEVLEVYKAVENAGFEVYFVGGCVRNLLMNIPVKDWDLTTSAKPEEIQKLFKDAYYNNDFGTVGIPVNENSVVEITTYRTEHGFSNKRHPDKVVWGKTIEEDLARRDFTMNAIAFKLIENDKQEYVDPYNGLEDIEERIIRCVGNPQARFKEDALRLMRAIRFASQLDFYIEEATGKEIKADAKLIKDISWERIRDELMKIMASPDPVKGITLLKESGILEIILPELLEGVGVSQVRPGRHHTTDVYTHNVMSLKHCPSTDPVVRFAALLHDVGKPAVKGEDKDGLVTFYNHEVAGARIAYEICKRLRFSKKDTYKVVNLIRWHMFSVNENLSDAGIR
jgi:tRNA nucleotidyltransferase (CCA-adding enzyme)